MLDRERLLSKKSVANELYLGSVIRRDGVQCCLAFKTPPGTEAGATPAVGWLGTRYILGECECMWSVPLATMRALELHLFLLFLATVTIDLDQLQRETRQES